MFVISGVTGNTGTVVAQTLIDQGQAVRVIVRSKEKGQVWAEQGAEVHVADILDIDAMSRALSGADGAYFLLPPTLSDAQFIENSFQRADAIAKAAQIARLPHAVILSSVGAHHARDTGPIKTVAYLEKQLINANIPLTALRPGYFLENIKDMMGAVLHDGVYPSLILPLDHKIDMVATQDIGQVIAESLMHPPVEPHRVIELRGAAQYSAQDIAAALSHALNKEIIPVPVPPEGWVDALKQGGLSQQAAEELAEMHDSINNGHIDFLNPEARKGQIELSDFVQKLVA